MLRVSTLGQRGVFKVCLGVFGALNATADTVLEVYDSKGVKIFENDDWQKGSGAGELPLRFSQVGAFGLPSGNGDDLQFVVPHRPHCALVGC